MADDDALPGELATRYRVDRELGRGGMGVVYAAHDRELDRGVAIKLMFGHLDPQRRRRFEIEANTLAEIQHAGVLRIFDAGIAAGHPYMVTELLDGVSLDERCAPEDALPWMLEAGEALQAVHLTGVLHRDIKPANIVRTAEGRVVLIDFGLVLAPEHTRMTETGCLVGTLDYLPPETLRGLEPSRASDWYSWGATLFRLLEGRAPFDRDDLGRYARTGELPPPRLRRYATDPAISRLLGACLQAEAPGRPQDLLEVRELLAPADPERSPASASGAFPPARSEDPTRPAPPSTRTARLPVAVALLALLLASWMRWAPTTPRPVPAPAGSPLREDAAVIDDPFPEAFAAALRRELAAVASAAGPPREGGEARETPDSAPSLLDGDPRHWGALAARLPSLGEFHAWLQEGGDPAALPPVTRDRLRELDRIFDDLGYLAPFRPHLDVRPAPPLPALPEPLRAAFAQIPAVLIRSSTALPDEVPGGWLAAACNEMEAAQLFRRRVEGALASYQKGGPAAPGMPRVYHELQGTPAGRLALSDVDLEEFTRNHWWDLEDRKVLAPWLRPGAAYVQRGLACLGRAARAGELESDAALELARRLARVIRFALGMAPGSGPLEHALGVRAEGSIREVFRVLAEEIRASDSSIARE